MRKTTVQGIPQVGDGVNLQGREGRGFTPSPTCGTTLYMNRPILIGESNPHSSDPRHALAPYPEGSSGHRLWRMLCDRAGFVDRRSYMERFERYNLSDLPAFESPEKFRGSTVILLGDKVRRRFGLPKVLLHPVRRDGVVYRQIPHPSGMNRWYNDAVNRTIIGMLMEELYCGGG